MRWKPASARRRWNRRARCASTHRSAGASPASGPCWPATANASRRWSWTWPCPTGWWTWSRKATTWPSASPANLARR
ncbi:hypothetical protein G6F63_016448 [Rhizopus arrhizus]|nr:hypothetical protein G6F63_016448 [Rhizopus arrhizus]